MLFLCFTVIIRFKSKEDSLPNEKSLHVDFLAGLLSELHI